MSSPSGLQQFTSLLSPHEAVRQILKASNIPLFDWTQGPWYQEVPIAWNEKFPLCVFDIEESDVESTFEKDYLEKFVVKVMVSALQQDIFRVASPYGDARFSITTYLDRFWDFPDSVLSGENFICNSWQRTGWVVKKDDIRGPDTNRVHISTSTYSMKVTSAVGTV